MMKEFLKMAVLTILFLIIIYEIYINTLYNYNYYSSLIEISIPMFAKMEEKDTHGGFHGEGEALAKIYFSNEQAEKFLSKIKENKHWSKFPMPENLRHYIHNCIDKEMEMPIIDNGYWFFLNRYNKIPDKYDYTELERKPSSNFSIAVIDTDSNMLYIYSLDT